MAFGLISPGWRGALLGMPDIPGDGAGWAGLLAEAVRALQDCFGPGELAYLTATSKVENPVRDTVLAPEWLICA